MNLYNLHPWKFKKTPGDDELYLYIIKYLKKMKINLKSNISLVII